MVEIFRSAKDDVEFREDSQARLSNLRHPGAGKELEGHRFKPGLVEIGSRPRTSEVSAVNPKPAARGSLTGIRVS